MTSTPANDPDERKRALAAALEAREARAHIKEELSTGKISFDYVVAHGTRGQTDEVGQHARVFGRLRVGDALLATPKIGTVKAAEILHELDLDEGTRLDQLSSETRTRLVNAVAAES
jgi:hypothetical protein